MIMDKIITLKIEYCNKYEEEPNAVLINEKDLFLLNAEAKKYLLKEHSSYPADEVCYYHGLKIIPIKHGETQVVEVLK